MRTSPLTPVLLALAMSVSACAGPGIMAEYGTAGHQGISTRCGGSYSVSEKENHLLVMAYAVSAVYKAMCDGNAPGTSRPVYASYQDAADEYIRTKKPQCRLTGGRDLTSLHSEFTFECPPAPAAAATAPKAKR